MSDIDINVTEEALEFDITATGPKGETGEQGPQGESGALVEVQDLGDISGAVEIDVTEGPHIIGNPTDEITLTSATGATAGFIQDFDLYFTAIETINWPANTIFSDGAAPDPSTAPYRIVGSVDDLNVITIDGVIEGYATL